MEMCSWISWSLKEQPCWRVGEGTRLRTTGGERCETFGDSCCHLAPCTQWPSPEAAEGVAGLF